jgi:hypothetical protein
MMNVEANIIVHLHIHSPYLIENLRRRHCSPFTEQQARRKGGHPRESRVSNDRHFYMAQIGVAPLDSANFCGNQLTPRDLS